MKQTLACLLLLSALLAGCEETQDNQQKTRDTCEKLGNCDRVIPRKNSNLPTLAKPTTPTIDERGSGRLTT